MSVKIRYPVGRAWVEVDAQSIKEAMKDLSEYVEVLGECQCGVCQSDRVRPSHRVAQGYDFYEMVCLACGAKLSFGQAREGGRLFPKRKDKNGYEVGKDGWHQYQGTQDGGEF